MRRSTAKCFLGAGGPSGSPARRAEAGGREVEKSACASPAQHWGAVLSFFLTGATLYGLSQQESDALLKGLNDVSASRTGFKSYPTVDLARDLQVKALGVAQMSRRPSILDGKADDEAAFGTDGPP